jgi:hypothetical protein
MFRVSFANVSFQMLFHWFALGLATTFNLFPGSASAHGIEFRQPETAECYKKDRMNCFSVGKPNDAFEKANEQRLNTLTNIGYNGGRQVIQIPVECPKEILPPLEIKEPEEESPCEEKLDPLVASVTNSIRATANAIVQEAQDIYKNLGHAAEYIQWSATAEKCPQPIKVHTHVKPKRCPTAMPKCKALKACEIPLDQRPNRSAYYLGAFSEEDLNNAMRTGKLTPAFEIMKMNPDEQQEYNDQEVNRLIELIQYS